VTPEEEKILERAYAAIQVILEDTLAKHGDYPQLAETLRSEISQLEEKQGDLACGF
jgi:hypothetical protein